MDWFGMMTGLGWPGMGLMALVWLGVILLVLWGLSNAFPSRPPPAEPPALEILQRRYARGEISAAEFRQAQQALGYRPPADPKAF